MAADTESDIWRRIRCAATLGRFRGPQEMFAEVEKYFPDMTYESSRRAATGRLAGEPRYAVDEIAEVISKVCGLRGVTVPEWWILFGFDGGPDESE